MWRGHRFWSVDDAIKFIRCCQSSSTATKWSSRSNVSRETGVSARARLRSAASSGDSATGRFPALPAQIRDQKRQRRRRDAIDAAGMPNGARPVCLQLMSDLVGQSRQRRIVEVVGQSDAFIAAIGFDVGGLAAEIDLVFRLDFELLGDLCRQFSEAWPNPCDIADADIRIGQQLERRAALTVLAQGKSMPRGFAWCDYE